MAAVRQPFGFKPSRSRGGTFNPYVQRYQVDAGNSRVLYIGDPVCLVSGMAIAACSAASSEHILGVIAQILDANQKPLTFSQPTRGPMVQPVSAAGQFVDVFTDPNNIFLVASDVTATPAAVGTFSLVTANASSHANVATGRSPLCLKITTITSVDSTHKWRIVGPSQSQRDFTTNPDWTEGVEAMFVNVTGANV